MSEKIKAKNCVSIDVYLPTVLPTFLLRLLLFRLLIQFFCSNYTFFFANFTSKFILSQNNG